MTAVPCFVIALTAATAAVYHSTSFSMKDAMPAEQPINAEDYVQTEGIPEGYKSAPLTSEDQECYQQPDIATDISSGSVKSGSSVVPTENHGAAVTTVDGGKKVTSTASAMISGLSPTRREKKATARPMR